MNAGAGQQRRPASEPGQELPLGFLQLADVAPRIAAQVRTQGGRRLNPAEQVRHRTMPQQVHVIDAVRPGRHPSDQARDLQMRVHPAFAARPDMLRDQISQPGALRQGHHRDQPGPRHEIRVIKRCVRLRQAMQQSGLTGVLSGRPTDALDTPIVPAQEAPFTLTRPNKPLFVGGSKLTHAISRRLPGPTG